MHETLSGIGPGKWNKQRLAQEQEMSALRRTPSKPQSVLYRIYTENTGLDLVLVPVVSRYFAGATILSALGIWFEAKEQSLVIEILGTADDLQSIVHLAGDIKVVNHQQSVLVTWSVVNRLDV